MSLSYNGTTSVLASSAPQTIGLVWSGSAWFKATTEGQGNMGALMTFGPDGNDAFALMWDGSLTKKLTLRNNFTSWQYHTMTTGFASITKWLWVGWTLDETVATNLPILYTLVDNTFSVLTSGSGLTTGFPGGPQNWADNQTFRFGCHTGGRTFDGLLGESAFWKRIRTAAEMEAVAFDGVNACPDHFNYLPQDGGRVQNLGSSGVAFTGTNLSAGENPPVRPAGRRG